jgi:hypothetical protein
MQKITIHGPNNSWTFIATEEIATRTLSAHYSGRSFSIHSERQDAFAKDGVRRIKTQFNPAMVVAIEVTDA